MRVLLAPAKDGRDSASASFQALRAALAPACADGGPRARRGRVAGRVRPKRYARDVFAAVVVDAPSLPCHRSGPRRSPPEPATRDDEGAAAARFSSRLTSPSSHASPASIRRLVVDALDPALAPVLRADEGERVGRRAPRRPSRFVTGSRRRCAPAEEHPRHRLARSSQSARHTVLLAAQRIETLRRRGARPAPSFASRPPPSPAAVETNEPSRR